MFFQKTQGYWLMDDWSTCQCNLSTFALLQEGITKCKVIYDPSDPKGNGTSRKICSNKSKPETVSQVACYSADRSRKPLIQ